MIPNIHQSIDEIIKDSSAQEKILWQQVRLLAGENAFIRQLYYCGNIAGSDFLIADPHAWFLGLSVQFSTLLPNSANFGFVRYHDQPGNVIFVGIKNLTYFDPVAAIENYSVITVYDNNILFNHITNQGYDLIKFIGYKISI